MKRTQPISRRQIVTALAEFAQRLGRRPSVAAFTRETGITQGRIYAHFTSWADACRAAGLPEYPPANRRIDDDQLIAAYRELTQRLGRFPAPEEFDRLTPFSFATLRRRIGRTEEVRRRVQGTADDRWVRNWLEDEWSRVRIAFAERSRDLEGREEAYDLAFVHTHDWRACPGIVLDAHDVLVRPPNRSRRNGEGD